MKDSFKKYLAEFVGTFILLVIGVGTAVGLAGYVGTALAFGVAIIIMAYSVGRISGGHVNPAVSFAMAILGKLSWKDFCGYVIAQISGALVGSAVVGAIAGGYSNAGANIIDAGALHAFTENGHYGVYYVCSFVMEMVLTFIFILAILGVTDDDKFSGQTGIVIGLALTGFHLVGDGVTNTSVNPARSLSAAVFAAFGNGEGTYGDSLAGLKEIWVFILAPMIGAASAALCWKVFHAKKEEVKEDSSVK